jgi:hypothetical protein
MIPGGRITRLPTSVLHGPLPHSHMLSQKFIIRLKLLAGTDSQLLHAIPLCHPMRAHLMELNAFLGKSHLASSLVRDSRGGFRIVSQDLQKFLKLFS